MCHILYIIIIKEPKTLWPLSLEQVLLNWHLYNIQWDYYHINALRVLLLDEATQAPRTHRIQLLQLQTRARDFKCNFMHSVYCTVSTIHRTSRRLVSIRIYCGEVLNAFYKYSQQRCTCSSRPHKGALNWTARLFLIVEFCCWQPRFKCGGTAKYFYLSETLLVGKWIDSE